MPRGYQFSAHVASVCCVLCNRISNGGSGVTFGREQVQQDAFTEGSGLFDHLGRACEEGDGHGEAEGLGGLEVDHELIIGRRLHWQIGWLLTL